MFLSKPSFFQNTNLMALVMESDPHSRWHHVTKQIMEVLCQVLETSVSGRYTS